MRHLGFAFVFLLASAARPVSASRDTDAVARALPACAELRDAMQGECWTPLAVLNAHGEPLVEGSPLDNRCDALYQAALIVCPAWPRTPRTAGWWTWYRRVREGWEPSPLPPTAPLDTRPGHSHPGCRSDDVTTGW